MTSKLVLNPRFFRLLIGIPALFVGLISVYWNYAGAQAHPLVADSWDQAFYSSLDVSGEVTANGYTFAKNQTNTVPVMLVSGYPPIALLTGYPPVKGPSSYPPKDQTGFPPITLMTEPPIVKITGSSKGDLDFNQGTCKRSPFVQVSGLPYGPVKVTWSPVPGATKYVVALGAKGIGKPPSQQVMILASAVVNAPGTTATLLLDKDTVIGVIKAQATFVIVVNAQTLLNGICINTRQISTEPKPTPTPLPTSTPTPPPPPPQNNNNDNNNNSGGDNGGCPPRYHRNAAGACVPG